MPISVTVYTILKCLNFCCILCKPTAGIAKELKNKIPQKSKKIRIEPNKSPLKLSTLM